MAKTRDMTTGSPMKHLILFCLPIIAGNAFQQLYSLVDSFVVGQVSVDALTAVSSAGWLDWLVLSVAVGFAQGFGIQAAQSFGAGDERELHRAVGQSLLLSAVTIIAVELLAQLCLWPVLVIMDMPAEIIRMTESYLRIIYAGFPLVMGFNLFSCLLRSVGDSVTPLIAMVVASLINIGLDFLYVLGFHWGVEGAAIATITSQGVSCIICLIAFLRLPVMRCSRADLRFDPGMSARLMKLGVPIAFQNVIISIGGLALQKVVNGFRYAFVAGFNAANRLVGVIELAGASLGSAVGTFASQNLGAGRLDRVKLGLRRAAQLSIILAALVGGAALLFGENVLAFLITDEDPVKVTQTIETAYQYLAVMSISLSMLYLLHVYRTTLQGIGDTFIPMVSGFVELAMRIGCALALPLLMGEWGVYISEIAAWTGAAVLLIWGYYRRIRVLETAMAK